jgi:hypothetical protein
LCDTTYIVMFRMMTIMLYTVVGMMKHVQTLQHGRSDVGDYSQFMCSDYSRGCGLLWAMSLRQVYGWEPASDKYGQLGDHTSFRIMWPLNKRETDSWAV